MPVGFLRLTGFVLEPALAYDAIHAIEGEPDRYGDRPVPEILTFVSWNIAYGRSCERQVDVLGSLGADVCLLQEVDRGCRRSGFRDVARWLAERLEMNWVFAGEFQEIGLGARAAAALTGQAILSRFPITSAVVIAFPNQAWLRWHANPWQPRRGRRMALRVNTAGVRVYNAHVESGKNDAFRRRQLAHVAAQERALRPTDAVVVAGDFNTGPFGHDSMLKMLGELGFVDCLTGHPGTRRTSIRHRHALDWMMVRGLAVSAAGVSAERAGSDHFPVWAALRPPAVP